MKNFVSGIYKFIKSVQATSTMLVGISLIVIFVMFILPSEKMREKAKDNIFWVLVGCGGLLLAPTIASEIAGAFVF